MLARTENGARLSGEVTGDMPTGPARDGSRQVLWLTLGLWAFTYVTFLMPSLAASGSIAWYGYPIVAAAVSVGLVLSVPLYILMRTLRGVWLPARIGIAAAAAAAAAWLHSMLDASIVSALRGVFAPDTVRTITTEILVDKFLSYVWIYELYVAAVGLIFSAVQAHRRDLMLLQARMAADQARLAALRFQINPHFLFNTLNSISSLVVTRRNEQAEGMIDKLAVFLRASLNTSDDQALVPLSEELETLDSYIEIESMRFGERLRYGVDCPRALEGVTVPSFILQPLVENAVKYAVATSFEGAAIAIRVWRDENCLCIAVSDDGRGDGMVPAGYFSNGLGLSNVRERLVGVYGEDARLTTRKLDPGFEAMLRMPLA
jgi:signal transduction histidine kinase